MWISCSAMTTHRARSLPTPRPARSTVPTTRPALKPSTSRSPSTPHLTRSFSTLTWCTTPPVATPSVMNGKRKTGTRVRCCWTSSGDPGPTSTFSTSTFSSPELLEAPPPLPTTHISRTPAWPTTFTPSATDWTTVLLTTFTRFAKMRRLSVILLLWDKSPRSAWRKKFNRTESPVLLEMPRPLLFTWPLFRATLVPSDEWMWPMMTLFVVCSRAPARKSPVSSPGFGNASSTSSVDYSSSRPTRRTRNPTSLSLKHQPKGRRFRRIEPRLPAAFSSHHKPVPIVGIQCSMRTRGTPAAQQTVSSSLNARDGWFKRIGIAKMPHLWRSRPERDNKSENELRG
mmetsp:Transcript_1896/g.4182  ORF Transcript_1896/g.4182 Transcript_1896/m.4182 type:complete len:342 (-) Transcript_1896:92-1117(-)